MEQIKSFCPNLIKELGYNEWNPEVAKRVQNWITVVLSCNNPVTVDIDDLEVIKNGGTPAVQTPQTATPVAPSVSSTPTPMIEEENTDDLPF